MSRFGAEGVGDEDVDVAVVGFGGRFDWDGGVPEVLAEEGQELGFDGVVDLVGHAWGGEPFGVEGAAAHVGVVGS